MPRFVEFAMHRVRMLIHFGITPYLVFDGDYLPSKAVTEDAREQRRAESKRVGLELLRMGKESQAFSELQKAIDVTPELARQLIEELKRHDVQYVVAPYEADAQLAYLERKNIIQGVISEDSDLLVFGVKRLITKLDQYGECIEINKKDFTACREVSLVGWSDVEFRQMAILSGCDYLPNISKIGLKTAYSHIRRYRKIERVIQILQLSPGFQVPPGYLDAFQRAEQTFLHQRVFCPLKQDIVLLNDIRDPPEKFDFIGKEITRSQAIGVAKGLLHPMSKKAIKINHTLSTNSPSPWTSKRASISTPFANGKPDKPIDTFFKPRRMPLAELDPNSFTPSPRQQILLDALPRSFPSTPVRSSVQRPQASSRLPDEGSAIPRGQQRPAGAEQSVSKKPRLCEELKVRSKDETLGKSPKLRSRFFHTKSTPASPCASKRPSKPANDIQIWSDDSVADIMDQIADPSQGVRPATATFTVFTDKHGPTSKKSEEAVNTTKVKYPELPRLPGLSQAYSRSPNLVAKAASQTKSKDLNITPRTNQSRHLAGIPLERETVGSQALEKQMPIADDLATKREESLDIADEGGGDPVAKKPEPVTHGKPKNACNHKATDELQPPFHVDETLSAKKQSEITSRPTSPPPHPRVRGSEDCIIPDSEDEGEESESESGGAPAMQQKINFASFLFSG